MKRFIALLAAATAIVACNRSKNNPQEQEQNQPHEITEFTDAGAYYYGQLSGYDFNMFCAYLLEGQTRVDDGVISGIGTALWLDMNVTKNADNTIPVGTYGPARNDYENNAFLKGRADTDDQGNQTLSGSYIYWRPLKGDAEYKLISNGSVKVNISGGKYSISAEVIADGEQFTFNYVGYFSYTDVAYNPDIPQEKVEYEVKNMSHGLVQNLGKAFNNDNLGDYCLWDVLLADSNYDFYEGGDGAEIQFEIITAGNATDITGTFDVKTIEFNENTISQAVVPGSALCGYIEEDGNDSYYYGCWYFPDNNSEKWLGATEGSVKISRSGDTYTIEFDMSDQFAQSSRFFGKYVGTMEFETKGKSPATRGRRVEGTGEGVATGENGEGVAAGENGGAGESGEGVAAGENGRAGENGECVAAGRTQRRSLENLPWRRMATAVNRY